MNALKVLAYPVVCLGAIGLAAWLHRQGAGLAASTYVPIAVAALSILGLERLIPARREWVPRLADLRTDAAFIVSVQVAFAKGLAFLALWGLAGYAHARAPGGPWPHGCRWRGRSCSWSLSSSSGVTGSIVHATAFRCCGGSMKCITRPRSSMR